MVWNVITRLIGSCKMTRKCCVTNCRGNYTKKDKVKTFLLPRSKDEKRRWLSIIPRDNIPESQNTVVCEKEKHWPANYKTVKVFGKDRPFEPPSIFENIKHSLLRTSSSIVRPRNTESALAEVRSILPDELSIFEDNDKIIDYADLCSNVIARVISVKFQIIQNDEYILLMSPEFISGCPKFLLKIYNNMQFESFHYGSKCTITSLSTNNITAINKWSQCEEALRYLKDNDVANKSKVIEEQLFAMGSTWRKKVQI